LGGGVGPGLAPTARPDGQPDPAPAPAPPLPRRAEKRSVFRRLPRRRNQRASSTPPAAATPRGTSVRHSLADPTPAPPRPKQARPNADARRSEGCTRMPGEPPSACIPSDPRAFAFPLPVAPASPAPPQSHLMLPRGQLFLPSAPTRHASHTTRAPAVRPPQGAPTLGPPVPFKPFRIDPLNREPTAEPAPTAPFKPSRTDPLNREPGAIPDPRPVHRIHEPAHIRESTRCAALHTRSQRRRQGIFAADARG
jgi:hypothetical protein